MMKNYQMVTEKYLIKKVKKVKQLKKKKNVVKWKVEEVEETVIVIVMVAVDVVDVVVDVVDVVVGVVDVVVGVVGVVGVVVLGSDIGDDDCLLYIVHLSHKTAKLVVAIAVLVDYIYLRYNQNDPKNYNDYNFCVAADDFENNDSQIVDNQIVVDIDSYYNHPFHPFLLYAVQAEELF